MEHSLTKAIKLHNPPPQSAITPSPKRAPCQTLPYIEKFISWPVPPFVASLYLFSQTPRTRAVVGKRDAQRSAAHPAQQERKRRGARDIRRQEREALALQCLDGLDGNICGERRRFLFLRRFVYIGG